MEGYKDSVLTINLSAGSIIKKKLNRSYISKYLGGEGYGTALLWYNTHHNTHPFSPRSILSFNTGPLTGTPIPASSITSAVFISPLTNMIETSAISGGLGCCLKQAGYDSLILYGTSTEPVYIYIDGPDIKIKSAAHLWGKDTYESINIIKDESGSDFNIMCIGNAGEKLSRLACICSTDHAAGQYGAGALMGCKNIKAIAVRGRDNINIADSGKLKRASDSLLTKMDTTLSNTYSEEAESKYLLYRQCGLSSIDDIVQFEYCAKYYGIDPLAAALTISFAIKWYQAGIINDNKTDGLKLSPGNKDDIIELLVKMGKREGTGELFADGLYYAALKIGGELTSNIEHIKHLERHYVSNPGDSSVQIIPRLLGICCISPDSEAAGLNCLASLYSAVTGVAIENDELSRMGDRTIALKNAINYKRNTEVRDNNIQNGAGGMKDKYAALGLNDILEEL